MISLSIVLSVLYDREFGGRGLMEMLVLNYCAVRDSFVLFSFRSAKYFCGLGFGVGVVCVCLCTRGSDGGVKKSDGGSPTKEYMNEVEKKSHKENKLCLKIQTARLALFECLGCSLLC